MTSQELVSLFMARRGAFVVTLWAITKPRVVNCPYPNPQKLAIVNGMLNWHYENAVNIQRWREEHPEPFTALSRVWGERVVREDNTLTPFVMHKNHLYLEVKVEKVNAEYIPEEVEGYLVDREEGRRQELEKPVVLRDYRLDHIRAVQFDRELHNIEG